MGLSNRLGECLGFGVGRTVQRWDGCCRFWLFSNEVGGCLSSFFRWLVGV